MNNFIYQDLKTNDKNTELVECILQGNTNRTFIFTLFDRGKQALLTSGAKIDLIVLYNPRMEYGKLTYDGSYVLKNGDTGYDITTIEETVQGGKFSIVKAPFHEGFVAYAGKCELILRIEDSNAVAYTYSMKYTVNQNNAYYGNSLPNNLPNYQALMREIEALKLTKANKNLDNVTVQDFKAKATQAGIGTAETGLQIKTKLEALTGVDRLDYTKLKNTPPSASTPEQTARALENLSPTHKLDYNSGLRNKPTVLNVKETASALNGLTGDERLDYLSLKNAPSIIEFNRIVSELAELSEKVNQILDTTNYIDIKASAKTKGSKIELSYDTVAKKSVLRVGGHDEVLY